MSRIETEAAEVLRIWLDNGDGREAYDALQLAATHSLARGREYAAREYAAAWRMLDDYMSAGGYLGSAAIVDGVVVSREDRP